MLFPIKLIDMSYSDLFYGYFSCANPFLKEKELLGDINDLWESEYRMMVTLSVRSGFYLLLEALALPAGSEVIMTGITIPDMPRIAEKHGLKIVPVDLSMRDLSIKKKSLESAITKKTRLVIIAHLYGAIIDLQPVCEVLEQHPDICLIEDCAQAFSGLNGYKGHSRTDVVMYSFGTIKTATALGGGILCIKDTNLFNKMSTIHQSWAYMPVKDYLKKLSKALILKMASNKLLLKLFLWYCENTNKKIDQIIVGMFRGFQGDNFFQLICRKPPLPLLAMLKRRLKHFDRTYFVKRVERFNYVKQHLRPGVFIHGIDNPTHTNWVCAVVPKNMNSFVQAIQKLGVYCFLGSPQIKAIAGTDGKGASECAESMENVVYVPIVNNMPNAMLIDIAEVMNQYA